MTDTPDRTTIVAEVTELLRTYVREEDAGKVTPDAHFYNDLRADSLDAVEIVIEIEDKYGVRFDDAETEKMLTINATVDLLMAHLLKKTVRPLEA